MWFGRNVRKDGGLSCMGLFLEMQRRMGRNALDPNHYPDLALEQWRVLEKGEVWIPGDGILFALEGREMGGHVAYFLSGTEVLHAVEHRGVIVSEIDEIDMRVELVYRWKGN